MSFIVAVDGPAGSGKGTITKNIEKDLGLVNIDTGATYRCVALAAIKHGLNANDKDGIIALLNDIEINMEKKDGRDVIYLNGEDVTTKIREKDVTQIVSIVSSIIPVRMKMLEVQRKLAEGKNVIVEGRDIGTVLFPNANVKIYLDASEEVRAERRFKEMQEKGIDMTYVEVLKNIQERDYNDKNKEFGALKKADDAIVIDTSNLTIEEATEAVKNEIKNKI